MLTVSIEFFNDCYIQPFNIVVAENAERKLYCLGCKSIEFYTSKSEMIWSTSGDGEMILPKNIMVYIREGKSKAVWGGM
jgi:hypothetical protein